MVNVTSVRRMQRIPAVVLPIEIMYAEASEEYGEEAGHHVVFAGGVDIGRRIVRRIARGVVRRVGAGYDFHEFREIVGLHPVGHAFMPHLAVGIETVGGELFGSHRADGFSLKNDIPLLHSAFFCKYMKK